MKKITCGIALIAALTLLGAPLAAHATEETEVASSESTEVEPLVPTAPTTDPSTATTTGTTSATPIPTAETVTPERAAPVETPQPIVSEATSTTTTTTSVAPVPSVSTSPTTSPEPPAIQYTTVLWEIQDGDWTKPQKFIAAIPGASMTGFGSLAKCGTDYQVDVYRPLADGTPPSVLWETGYLLYAHDGGFLAYELDYTPYKLFTTDNCKEETPSTDTPPTHDGPTTPDAPGTGSTGGGTAPLPTNTEVTPLVESPAAPSLHTALEATGTTEVLPTDKPATHSLAYTGPNEVNNIGAGIALVVILAGLLIVVLSRNRRP